MKIPAPSEPWYVQWYAQFDRRWSELCAEYAPLVEDVWAYTDRYQTTVDQGWKLHLSATIGSAIDLFERSIQAILVEECAFKAASSRKSIVELNSGRAGRSQVGKIMTIYCPEPDKARRLAERLHLLTLGIKSPIVPSDRRFRPGSAVFYRFGSFKGEYSEKDGKKEYFYRGPNNEMVPDKRTFATAVPSWAVDPFVDPDAAPAASGGAGSSGKRYKAVKPFGWRGRGGVYLARDTADPAGTLYVLKEGLRHGEADLKGGDGYLGLKVERRNLDAISRVIRAPRPIELFEQDGNRYLLIEHIDGKNLDELVEGSGMTLAERLDIARQVAGLMASLHAAGWAWRDCKLNNLLYADGNVWAIDFEGAMRIKGRKKWRTGTEKYYAEFPHETTGPGAIWQDRFALGVTLHALLSGVTTKEMIEGKGLTPMPEAVPAATREHILLLQCTIPRKRPTAAAIYELLSVQRVVASTTPERHGGVGQIAATG